MRCHRARRLAGEYVDGELRGRALRSLEAHLARCPECRSVVEDFRSIRDAAEALETPEPPDAVWTRIRAEVARRSAAPAAAPARSRAASWLAPGPVRWAASAALAFALVGGGILVGLRMGAGGRTGSDPAARERFTMAKLDEAERYYEKALSALGEAYAAGGKDLAPEVKAMLDRNLQVIDGAVQSCRAAVAAEPDNVQAWNYLLTAYGEKLSFLDAAVKYEKTNASKTAGDHV